MTTSSSEREISKRTSLPFQSPPTANLQPNGIVQRWRATVTAAAQRRVAPPLDESASAGGRPTWRSAFRRRWQRYRWWAFGALFVLATVLGALGGRGDLSDRVYTSFQLFVLEYQFRDQSGINLPLEIARFLAPAVAVGGTILFVVYFFDERLQELRVWFCRDHIVVCGLGSQGQELVENFLDDRLFRNFLNQAVGIRGVLRVAVVEVDRANPATRAARDAGANVVFGDATKVDVLGRVRVDRARYLFAVAGQDGVNAQIAAHALELTTGRQRPLEMFVHLDAKLCRLIIDRPRRDGARVEFFNVYERAARTLLEEHPPFCGNGASRLHVLVLGAGQLGNALAVGIAREWRDRPPPNGVQLRLSLVDAAADAKTDALRDRELGLEQDCEFVPHQVDVESPAFERLLASLEFSDVDVAYVCFDDDTRCLRTTFLLCHELPVSRVITRMTAESDGLAALLAEYSRGARQAEVVPFSVAKLATRLAVAFASRRGEFARQVHKTYLRERLVAGEELGARPSLAPWESLPDEIKESNLRQADQIMAHLERMGFRVKPLDRRASPMDFSADEIERMARFEHESWLAEKEGWTYAPERNDAARLHPDVRSWDDLPGDRKEINRGFVRSWPEMLRNAGILVVRA